MIEQGANYPSLSQVESPIPAMRAAGLVDFNCFILMNDGTWKHYDGFSCATLMHDGESHNFYGWQRGGGYTHVEVNDGGSVARDAQAMWGAL